MYWRLLVCVMMIVLPAHAEQLSPNTLSLDGEWQILFDDAGKSRAGKLHLNENFERHADVRSIQVPSVWERIERDYEGVAVYRKGFDISETWQDKIVHLHFDAVNYRAEVYLNDQVVGVHEGGFTPFSFRVDALLKAGERNVLTLRVVGPILLDTDKVIDGVGAMETPQWRGGITGGIWQSVHLEASDKAFIDDLFVSPEMATDRALVALSLVNYDEHYHRDDIELVVREFGSNRIVGKTRLEHRTQPGKSQLNTAIDVPKAKRWSPDTPNLYTVTANISRNGVLSHSVTERFGFREFSINNNRFQLNGEDIYVKAVFLEGIYPVGVAAPADLELARKEIRMAKEAGFNMIRPWRRPPPPEWLDLADEMGVMVIGSPALECMDLPVDTPDLPRRVLFEIEQTIARDRNHASIVMWELFNELRRPILKQMMAETAMMARDTDPSRLILDESGGWAFGAKVYLPRSREFTYFNDVHTYPGPNMTNAWYDKFLGVGHTAEARKQLGIQGKPIGHNLKPGVTSFVSELGYGSYVDFDPVNARFEREGNPILPATRYHKQLGEQLSEVITGQLSHVYASPQAFYREQQHIHGLANARMIEATRANPNITGYCVHALTGGDWIMGAGILDLWRNPKGAVFDFTQAANQPRILSIRTFPRNAYQGDTIDLQVTGINDLSAIEGTLTIDVTDASGNTVWRTEESVEYARAVSQLFEHRLPTEQLKGSYQITATITHNGKTVARNRHGFDVFAVQAPATAPVAIVDQTGRVMPFLNKYAIQHQPFGKDTDLTTPVLVAMADREGDEQTAIRDQLNAFARRGGTVVYLQFPMQRPKWNHGVLSKGTSKYLPVEVNIKASSGLWGGMSHVVGQHPIFDGLPQNQAMYGAYENVRAKFSMVDLPHTSLVTVVANDNFPDMTLMKRHYQGTGDVWTGSDLSEVPTGKGRIVLSTLDLIPHIGKDPVADVITNNLIGFYGQE
ncbi:glycoside hydrolase family 2 protein [Microbulbifer agarilyticus]|uniref:glycoside hydrolase family 2 protein n=1 Tax=Microbulbifer agarilyticus TaxID=260552 RepID=UPI001CD2B19A|nr:sugar-binding domain-containing protein [Microbulbifer agarilyticus]MCA0900802.1 hypothetical protein [Microbulbifer agarilyticus]